ncbi:MAG: chemotaxis protein CheW [Lachnospiraceae bacterium]|nr:chemotaxis protein CheW [Lachnospiraceae bacterium]
MEKELAVVNDEERRYIMVKLGEEQYGIDIRYIDNIVRLQSITRVPSVQSYFPGVINLRGEVVPVMSLRIRMGLPQDEMGHKTRIIIVKVTEGNIGVLVDEVINVVTVRSEDVEKVSHDVKNGVQTFISGVGKVENGLISLLDISTLIEEEA